MGDLSFQTRDGTCAPYSEGADSENNRMGETRDLVKKIRDSKGTFHAKIGTVKGRNNVDLTEAEAINKRWQEYTEEDEKDVSCEVLTKTVTDQGYTVTECK